MALIGITLTIIGFASIFVWSATGAEESIRRISFFILFLGIALLSLARYRQSVLVGRIWKEASAPVPFSNFISKIFWLFLSITFLVQGASELLGMPLIKY